MLSQAKQKYEFVFNGGSSHTPRHLLGEAGQCRCCFSFALAALNSLAEEIVPDPSPTSASKEYRKSVAIGLFYKVRMTGELYVFVPGADFCCRFKGLMMLFLQGCTTSVNLFPIGSCSVVYYNKF